MLRPRFLASEVLRDYWLSGVRISCYFHMSLELIPDLAVWSKLEFPLECADSKVADFAARRRVLYRRLGLYAARFDAPEQDTYVVPSCFCGWFGCSTMVSSM